jgi:hypothetical protein
MGKPNAIVKKGQEQKLPVVPAAAPIDFSADAGSGMEGADAQSFAIPFLSVLQKGSPQVDEASGVAIEGARQGMFFNSVTGRMYDGKSGLIIVPAAYQRRFVRWAPRETGGGFKGELTADQAAQLRAAGAVVEVDGRLFFPDEAGNVNPKRSDRLADVRNHFCVMVDPNTGEFSNVLISLTSTQIKKSKTLMSMLASVKLKRGDGSLYTPPTYSQQIRVTSTPEQNDQGSWFGVRFESEGLVTDVLLYEAAKAFHATVISGAAQATYSAPEGGTPAAAASQAPGF